jgi:hypothetical protein
MNMFRKEPREVPQNQEIFASLGEREMAAYQTFDAITGRLIVRRQWPIANGVDGAVRGLTTIYQPTPMSVDRKLYGQPTVALVLARRELFPPEMSFEADFWGAEYFGQPSPRLVRPRLLVLSSMAMAEATVMESYLRPPVEIGYGSNGTLEANLQDAQFGVVDELETGFSQASYLHWLSRLATQQLA